MISKHFRHYKELKANAMKLIRSAENSTLVMHLARRYGEKTVSELLGYATGRTAVQRFNCFLYWRVMHLPRLLLQQANDVLEIWIINPAKLLLQRGNSILEL